MAGIEFKPGPPEDETIRTASVVGVSELAAFLRLPHPETVHVWSHRAKQAAAEGRQSDHLPTPDYVSINGHWAWRRLTVIIWAARTNRLPPWLVTEGARWRPETYRRPRRTKAELEAARRPVGADA